MSARGVAVAVVLVLVVAAGFVAAGVAMDATFFGVAAIIAAVAFGALMVGLMALVLTLMGTIRELTRTVQQVTEQTLPLLNGFNETIAGVNTELARLDSVVASVQHISSRGERVADVVHDAVANPLIKAMAFVSGTGAAVRSARRSKRSKE